MNNQASFVYLRMHFGGLDDQVYTQGGHVACVPTEDGERSVLLAGMLVAGQFGLHLWLDQKEAELGQDVGDIFAVDLIFREEGSAKLTAYRHTHLGLGHCAICEIGSGHPKFVEMNDYHGITEDMEMLTMQAYGERTGQIPHAAVKA